MRRFEKELYGLFGCKNCRHPLSEHIQWKCMWGPTRWEWVFQPNARHFKWAKENSLQTGRTPQRIVDAFFKLEEKCSHRDETGKLFFELRFGPQPRLCGGCGRSIPGWLKDEHLPSL